MGIDAQIIHDVLTISAVEPYLFGHWLEMWKERAPDWYFFAPRELDKQMQYMIMGFAVRRFLKEYLGEEDDGYVVRLGHIYKIS